jgi:hypothetical protein
MKRWHIFTLSVVAIVAALGCVPRRLFWSPDGQHGAIATEKALYLANADGKLSDPIDANVQLVAWAPDSKSFIAAQIKPIATWREAEPLFTEARRAELIALAPTLRHEILAYQGDWNQFKPSVTGTITGGEMEALLLYIRDHRGEGLPEKFGAHWDEVKHLRMTACELAVYKLTGDTAKPDRTIAVLPDGVLDMRLSPNGKLLAFTTPIPSAVKFALGRLLVINTSVSAPATPIEIDQHVAAYADWSPDGTQLYYGKTNNPPTNDQSEFTLGSLTRRTVADDKGDLLTQPAAPEDLAGLLFWSLLKVRCLRDGRVLFTSGEVSLPATSADMPKQLNLFTIDPARQPTVTRLLPREADDRLEGLSMGEFELSPDEKRVVVVASSKKVSVVTLATGKIDNVITTDDPGGPNNLPSMPVWRTADQLVIAVPPGHEWGTPDRAEVILWAPNAQPQKISQTWPDLFKKTETQPAEK